MTYPGMEADNPLSYSKIEKIAKFIRKEMGLDFVSLIPGIQLFEKLSCCTVVNGRNEYTHQLLR